MASGEVDGKLLKLAQKLEKDGKTGGNAVLLAVPVKRGGIVAATVGATSGSVRGVIKARDQSRGGADGSTDAGRVLGMIGDGSDFVLAFTDEHLCIVRLIAFGATGKPVAVPNRALRAVHTSAEMKKKLALEFGDGSQLGFTLAKEDHRGALQQVAAKLWSRGH